MDRKCARLSVLMVVTAFGLGACTSNVTTSPSPSVPGPSADATSEPSTPPATEAPASAEPSAAAGSPTVAWEAAEAQEEGVRLTDVFADGDTWVLGGWTQNDGPAAWTSPDGQAWTGAEVENQQPEETFRGPQLGPIDRLGDSLISIGTFIGCCDGRGVYGWLSADGTSWEAIESTSPLYTQGYWVADIAVGDPALVAIEVQYAEYGGRIWSWTEGTSWVETTPGVESGERSGIHLSDVTWSQDRFVAVGHRAGADQQVPPPSGTSWVSTDGATWEESAPDSTRDGVRLTSVAALPDGGFAAVGSVDSSSGSGLVAYTSPDGLRWTAAPQPISQDFQGIGALLEVPGGLLAFGGSSVWSSADGIEWTDADPLDGGFVAGATMDDQVVVIVQGPDPAGLSFLVQRGAVSP